MNNNYQSEIINNRKIYLWKPSINFWMFIFFSFIIWLLLGPIWWRHVDDFGPIQFFINKEWSFLDSYKLLDGFGSYPPIWSFWSGFSYLFKGFGLTETRYISLLLGFISNSISAYLTVCICLNLIFNSSKINQFILNRFIYVVEILSISFNLFNPEIMFHSITYMPYHLSTITTLFLLIVLIPLNKNYVSGSLHLSKKLLKISFSKMILLIYISIFLSFQSIILLFGFGTTLVFTQKSNIKKFLNIQFLNKKIKIIYLFLKNYFQKKNYFLKVFNLFLIYLPISYIYKIFIIYKRSYKPGGWANGIDNIYDLTFSEYPFFEWILKVINNTISIIGQAIYPFRFYQDNAAILISILLFSSLTLIGIFKKSGKVFLINIVLVFSITILLATVGNFIYSPTRHTIFLYPYVWILIILIFFEIYKLTSGIKFSIYNYILTISLIVLSFNVAGLINSHGLIQYKKDERIKLANMAEISNFFIDDMYLIENVSKYSTHGSLEYNLTKNKLCTLEKIRGEKEITFFVYNHRYRFDIKNNNHLEDLINRSSGCIKKQDDIEVVDKIEKENLYDIEQNNNIYNGGSNIFSYVIKVKKNEL